MNKKIVPILTLLIIVLSSGITYAWLSWRSTNTNVTFNIQNMVITYNAGSTVTGNLIPTSSRTIGGNITKTITVSSNITVSSFNLYLDLTTFPTALAEESLKWEIYEGTTTLLNSGNFDNAVQGDSIAILNDYATTNQKTYTLYIWIDGANYNNPTAMQGKTFSFNLRATASNNPEQANILNYEIYGNSVQTSTPTIDAPVAIQTLGTYNSTTSKYDITVTARGKNIYDNIDFTNTNTTYWKPNQNVIVSQENDGYEVIFNQNTSTPGLIWRYAPHSLEIGKTYTVTIKAKGIDRNSVILSFFSGSNVTFSISSTEWTTLSQTFTFSQYVDDFILFYASAPTIGTGFAIQWMNIYEGDEEILSYEPYYEPVTYTISLDEPLRCIGTVCDYIDYENGKIVRRVGVVILTGNETNISYQSYYSNTDYKVFLYNFPTNIGFNSGNVTSISSHMQSQAASWSNHGDGKYTFQDAHSNSRAYIWMSFAASRFTDLAAFKQYLQDENTAGRPVTVLYPLYNQTYETLTLPIIPRFGGTDTTILSASDDNISASLVEGSYYK